MKQGLITVLFWESPMADAMPGGSKDQDPEFVSV